MDQQQHIAFPSDSALSSPEAPLEWSSPTSVLQDADSSMRASVATAKDSLPFPRQAFPSQQFLSEQWVSVRKEGNRFPRAGISPKGSSGSSQNPDGAGGTLLVRGGSLPAKSSSQAQYDKISPRSTKISTSFLEALEVSTFGTHQRPAGSSSNAASVCKQQQQGLGPEVSVPVLSTSCCCEETDGEAASLSSGASCEKEVVQAQEEVRGGALAVSHARQQSLPSTSDRAESHSESVVEDVHQEGTSSQELPHKKHLKEDIMLTATKSRCPGRNGARFPPPVYKDLQKVVLEEMGASTAVQSSSGNGASPLEEDEPPVAHTPQTVVGRKALTLGRGTSPAQLSIPNDDHDREYNCSDPDSDEDVDEDELTPLGSVDSGHGSSKKLSQRWQSDHCKHVSLESYSSRSKDNKAQKHDDSSGLSNADRTVSDSVAKLAVIDRSIGEERGGGTLDLEASKEKAARQAQVDVPRLGVPRGQGQEQVGGGAPGSLDRKMGTAVTLRMIQHLKTMRRLHGSKEPIDLNWADHESLNAVSPALLPRLPGLPPLSPGTPSPRRVIVGRAAKGGDGSRTPSPREVEEGCDVAKEGGVGGTDCGVGCGQKEDDFLERQKLGWHYRRAAAFGAVMPGDGTSLGKMGGRVDTSDAVTQSDERDFEASRICSPPSPLTLEERAGTLEDVWSGVELAKEVARERQQQQELVPNPECRMDRGKTVGNVQIWVPEGSQEFQAWHVRGEMVGGVREAPTTFPGPRGKGRLQNFATALFRGCQKKGDKGGMGPEKEQFRHIGEQGGVVHRDRKSRPAREDVQNKPPGPKQSGVLQRSHSLSVVEKMKVGHSGATRRGLSGKSSASLVNVPPSGMMSQTAIPCIKSRVAVAPSPPDPHFVRHTIGPLRTRSGPSASFHLSSLDGSVWPPAPGGAPSLSPPAYPDPPSFTHDRIYGCHHHQTMELSSCPHSLEHGNNGSPQDFVPSAWSQQHQMPPPPPATGYCMCSHSPTFSQSAPSSWAARKAFPPGERGAASPDQLCSPPTPPWNQAVSPQSVSGRVCGCHGGGGRHKGGGGNSPCEHCWIPPPRVYCDHSIAMWAERGGRVPWEVASVDMVRFSPSPGRHTMVGCEKVRAVAGCCSPGLPCRPCQPTCTQCPTCGQSPSAQKQGWSGSEEDSAPSKEKRLLLPRLAKPTLSLPPQRSHPMAPWADLEIHHRKGY